MESILPMSYAQLAFLPPILIGWRVRQWIHDPLGARIIYPKKNVESTIFMYGQMCVTL